MAKRNRSAPAKPEEKHTVVVCRGGDCGSRAKHPDVDHLDQLRQIRESLHPDARIVVSKCLDACAYSNVIVVTGGADSTIPPTWIGHANDQEITAELIDWVRAGGPADGTPGVLVELHKFSPTRRNRIELAAMLTPKQKRPGRR